MFFIYVHSLSSEIAISTTIAQYPWSSSPLEVILLDFGKELWMNLNKHKALQDSILKKILGALQELWKDECLEFRGFPLLSDFNVSLVFVLCHLFDKVWVVQIKIFSWRKLSSTCQYHGK